MEHIELSLRKDFMEHIELSLCKDFIESQAWFSWK